MVESPIDPAFSVDEVIAGTSGKFLRCIDCVIGSRDGVIKCRASYGGPTCEGICADGCDIAGCRPVRSAGAKIYANAIQCIVARRARGSHCGDRVIATAALQLGEACGISNILRARE